MVVRLDSRFIPAADRHTAVREAIAQQFVPVTIDFPAPEGPVIQGAIADIGDLRLLSVRSNATKAERTQTLARDDSTPSLFLGMQMAGQSLIVQHDRQAVLRPGELILYESSEPYTLVDEAGIAQVQIRIPVSSIALPRDVVRQLLAVTLSPGHPVADLAATYFQRMARRPDLFGAPESAIVSKPSIELVRALITTHLDLHELAGDSAHASLCLRIMEYARANLRDPNLSAEQLASEHHISVRHLYNILAEERISLGAWIREQRLTGARNDLSSKQYATVPIGAIAHRWGFRDVSTFGRLFREAYSMSPREFRRASDLQTE